MTRSRSSGGNGEVGKVGTAAGRLSPAARQLARAHGLDPAAIPGTGQFVEDFLAGRDPDPRRRAGRPRAATRAPETAESPLIDGQAGNAVSPPEMGAPALTADPPARPASSRPAARAARGLAGEEKGFDLAALDERDDAFEIEVTEAESHHPRDLPPGSPGRLWLAMRGLAAWLVLCLARLIPRPLRRRRSRAPR